MTVATDTKIEWIAFLSNGEVAVQDRGEFEPKPGERASWVKMCEFCRDNDLYVRNVGVLVNDELLQFPGEGFHRFSQNIVLPDHYSLQYHVEADDLFGDMRENHFIDLAAHYDGYTVHVVRSTDDAQQWVFVTPGNDSMAPTPSRND
jgi:hypothetical protein